MTEKAFAFYEENGIITFEAEDDAQAIKIAESIIKMFDETEDQKPN